jgi:hypothetical protein
MAHLVNKQEVMAIACIKVRWVSTGLDLGQAFAGWESARTFDSQRANMIKMITIYMRIHAEKTTGQSPDRLAKIPRERHAFRPQSSGLRRWERRLETNRSCWGR